MLKEIPEIEENITTPQQQSESSIAGEDTQTIQSHSDATEYKYESHSSIEKYNPPQLNKEPFDSTQSESYNMVNFKLRTDGKHHSDDKTSTSSLSKTYSQIIPSHVLKSARWTNSFVNSFNTSLSKLRESLPLYGCRKTGE